MKTAKGKKKNLIGKSKPCFTIQGAFSFPILGAVKPRVCVPGYRGEANSVRSVLRGFRTPQKKHVNAYFICGLK